MGPHTCKTVDHPHWPKWWRHRCDRHSSLHESNPIRPTTCRVLQTGDSLQATSYREPPYRGSLTGTPQVTHHREPPTRDPPQGIPYMGSPTWARYRRPPTWDLTHATYHWGPNNGPSSLAQMVETHRSDRHSSLHESNPIRRTTYKVRPTWDPLQVTPYRGHPSGDPLQGPHRVPQKGSHYRGFPTRDHLQRAPSGYPVHGTPYRGPRHGISQRGPSTWDNHWGPPTVDLRIAPPTGDPLQRTRYWGPLQGYDTGDHLHGTKHVLPTTGDQTMDHPHWPRCDRHSGLHESNPVVVVVVVVVVYLTTLCQKFRLYSVDF
jgi:hypothetical protein